MAILNYTTTVPVDRSMGEIQGKLARAGAKFIQVDFEVQSPVGLRFVVATPLGDRQFALPANIDGVWQAIQAEYKAGQIKERRLVCREQAARVAWRILKDWLEAQLAIIEAGMANLDQVMLPYMWDGKQKSTMYQLYMRQLPESPEAQRGEANDR